MKFCKHGKKIFSGCKGCTLCYAEVRKTGKTIICKICGKERYYNLYRIKKSLPKFCSNECKYEDFRRRNVKKYGYKKCEVCGKEFYFPPYKQRKGNRFCSKTCAGKINIKNMGTRMLGRKHTIFTKGKMSVVQKRIMGSDIMRRRLSEIQRQKNLGKGKISSNQKARYHGVEYKIWRDKVYARDDYTYQDCGDRNGKGKSVYLTAHHIKPLALYPELRFDVSNGQTLCLECHRKTDTWGRRKCFRKFSFEKYAIKHNLLV